MNATETRAVIERYFDLIGRGEDFGVCYADDVRWTTFDGGTTVVGPAKVRDYLIELHENMPRARWSAARVCGRDCIHRGRLP